MKLTSKISHYDSRWPALFAAEKARIAKGLGTELVGIYHVGSTAVPGLAAKPEIDLLIEVSEHRNEPARDSARISNSFLPATRTSTADLSIDKSRQDSFGFTWLC